MAKPIKEVELIGDRRSFIVRTTKGRLEALCDQTLMHDTGDRTFELMIEEDGQQVTYVVELTLKLGASAAAWINPFVNDKGFLRYDVEVRKDRRIIVTKDNILLMP